MRRSFAEFLFFCPSDCGERGRGVEERREVLRYCEIRKDRSRLIVIPFPFLCTFLSHDSDMINFCCRTHSPEISERLLLS